MSASPYERVICIQGPTASGKSALAEEIARRKEGEIVSADSMQIYIGMDIGTAKTPPQERGVAYHCIDIVRPGQAYSAALFQHDARKAIQDIQSRGHLAILCGGTGLYVRAVLDEMDFARGDSESDARRKYTALAEKLGNEKLHDMLAQADPQSAELIHPHNVRRVIRAFEMLEEGESYAQRKRDFKNVPAHIPSVKLALDLDRELLYSRIDARVDTMIENGLVDEVQNLLGDGFRDALTSSQAIGYKEIVSYLDGCMPLDEAVSLIKQSSRRYAKRQLTWLRSDSEIIWLHANDGITDTLVATALDAIERA